MIVDDEVHIYLLALGPDLANRIGAHGIATLCGQGPPLLIPGERILRGRLKEGRGRHGSVGKGQKDFDSLIVPGVCKNLQIRSLEDDSLEVGRERFRSGYGDTEGDQGYRMIVGLAFHGWLSFG